jgi:cyclic-di-GMP phosphodiesterase TipF (flagellum assembly factor)
MQHRSTSTATAPGAWPRRACPHLRIDPGLLETVRAALTDNRVDLYLQPIVACRSAARSSTRASRACATRTGRVMMPAEYLTVAEPGGLVTAIDNLLLFRCVQIVRPAGDQGPQGPGSSATSPWRARRRDFFRSSASC